MDDGLGLGCWKINFSSFLTFTLNQFFFALLEQVVFVVQRLDFFRIETFVEVVVNETVRNVGTHIASRDATDIEKVPH